VSSFISRGVSLPWRPAPSQPGPFIPRPLPGPGSEMMDLRKELYMQRMRRRIPTRRTTLRATPPRLGQPRGVSEQAVQGCRQASRPVAARCRYASAGVTGLLQIEGCPSPGAATTTPAEPSAAAQAAGVCRGPDPGRAPEPVHAAQLLTVPPKRNRDRLPRAREYIRKPPSQKALSAV
jgi:hypothetical protein